MRSPPSPPPKTLHPNLPPPLSPFLSFSFLKHPPYIPHYCPAYQTLLPSVSSLEFVVVAAVRAEAHVHAVEEAVGRQLVAANHTVLI